MINDGPQRYRDKPQPSAKKPAEGTDDHARATAPPIPRLWYQSAVKHQTSPAAYEAGEQPEFIRTLHNKSGIKDNFCAKPQKGGNNRVHQVERPGEHQDREDRRGRHR